MSFRYGQSGTRQKICAEAARDFKKKHCALGPCSIENHYNNKLDKCFVIVRINLGVIDAEKVGHVPREEKLYDVFQSKEPIGAYIPCVVDGSTYTCFVGHETCKSADEFDVLVKPYMEE